MAKYLDPKADLTFRKILVVTVVAALFLSGCGGDSKEQERRNKEAEDKVYEAYQAHDYPRIIELVDSLKPLGSMSEGKACYWMGYAYDRMMQKRMAELYWKTGIAAGPRAERFLNSGGTVFNESSIARKAAAASVPSSKTY